MGRYLGAHNWCYGAVSNGLIDDLIYKLTSNAGGVDKNKDAYTEPNQHRLNF